MKISRYLVTAVSGVALAAAMPGYSASLPDITGSPQMVVTMLPGAGGSRPDNLAPGDINVTFDKAPAPIIHL